MLAYDYQLLLKHLLEHGVAWAPGQEIVYRDQIRYTYRELYRRVLALSSALQSLGVGEGTKVGVIEWDSHRYLEMYFGIPGIDEYFANYGISAARMASAKPDAIVMHPGPMNRGIEIESSLADSPNSVITQQVTNGVAVRMAVLERVGRTISAN